MFGFIKRLFCEHSYKKIPSIHSERRGHDNVVIEKTYYGCEKCHHNYTVIENVKFEKGWYEKHMEGIRGEETDGTL